MDIKKDSPLIIELKKSKLEKITELIRVIFRGILILFFLGILASAFSSEDFHQGSFNTRFINWYGTEIKPEMQIEEKNIAIIPITGMIMNKNMQAFDGTTSENILQMLQDIEEDNTIKAVILKIDSPGGTVLDSEKIAQKVAELKEKKKVYALLESMATSGGYYIASQAEKIFAYKETITGSIGVIMEIPNAKKLMDKVGVEMIAIKSGNMKSMGSPFDEFTPEAQEIFQRLADEAYETFVERVSTGRNMSIEEVKELGDGRIYSGKQALANGLIDSIEGISGLKKQIEEDSLEDANLLEFYIPRSPFEEFMNPAGAAIQSWIFPQKVQEMTLYYK